MRVAAIQQKIVEGAAEQNRRRAAELIREAAAQGAELALLPELWPCGFALENIGDLAETMRDGSIGLLRRLARELNLFIIGGSVAEKRDGKCYNTSVAINEAGEITAKYRKTHLYPHGLREDLYFSHGDEWTLTECGYFSIGMTVCYDTYFPEFARNLCLRGAQLLTAPVACSVGAIEGFQIMTKARAVENHSFFMMANHADNGANLPDDQRMAGGSLIISPYGKVLAEAGPEEAVIWADLSIDELYHLRVHRNVLNDRRNILDEIDNSQL